MDRGTLERDAGTRSGARPLTARGSHAPRLVTVVQEELTNATIADALEELGDLYELDGAVVHRVQAYRTAAKTVREASVSVAALARRACERAPGNRQDAAGEDVPAPHHGSIPAAERLAREVPAGLIAITRLPGWGPSVRG